MFFLKNSMKGLPIQVNRRSAETAARRRKERKRVAPLKAR